jgi:hypothetical protein
VRRQQRALGLEQRMPGGQRLGDEGVEAGAGDAAVLERGSQGVLVDERAARGVDQERGRLHRGEEARPDEPAGLVGQWRVQRHDVRPLRQLLEAGRLGAGGADRLVGDHRVMCNHVHADPGRALGDRAPDRAEADDSEDLAGDAAHRACARARPVAGPHRAVVEMHAPRQAEQQREHVLGDLLGAEARRVRDDDATAGGLLDLDVVQADPVARDDSQLRRRVEQRGADLGGADEQRVGAGDVAQQRLLVPAGRAHDIRAERREHLGLDLVRRPAGVGHEHGGHEA